MRRLGIDEGNFRKGMVNDFYLGKWRLSIQGIQSIPDEVLLLCGPEDWDNIWEPNALNF